MAIIDVGAKVKFDSALFSHPFPKACDINCCKSSCCEAGVIVDLEEEARIMKVKGELLPLLLKDRREVSKWFTPAEAEDFERGGDDCAKIDLEKYRSTGTGTNYCNFFNPGHGCSVQKLAVDKGLHKWAYKPQACILYPVYKDLDGVIKPDTTLDDEMWCCNKGNHETSVFRACLEEIEFVAGKDAIEKLKAFENQSAQEADAAPAQI